MVTFYITTEERRRAQKRAAELDIDKSDPPGRFPYVWDNRLNSVKRWYDYGSRKDKVATIRFDALPGSHTGRTELVECTTQITHHPPRTQLQPKPQSIHDPHQHRALFDRFLIELLDSEAKPIYSHRSPARPVIAPTTAQGS